MKAQALVILALSAIQAHAQEAPCKVTAKTESGVVCGTLRKDANGNEFASFFGIPYAKAPYGDLRFAPPQPREPFDGVFNATSPAPLCYQPPGGVGVAADAPMDEDCLILNIYVPKNSLPDQEGETKPLPVMVFVPGGAFVFLSSGPDFYGPEYLMTKGIIVITMQHRLGAFGFLTLQTEEIPGNTGLLDVIFALKWVQNNIGNMGGNPSEVTLGGYSSGGMTASLISVLPAVRGLGLFKRVMALGGNVLTNAYTTAPRFSRLTTQLFLDGMGLQKNQSERAIYEELISAPVEKIIEATAYVRNATDSRIFFSPVVETRQEDTRLQIIPNDPEYLINEGYGREYTKMMGFTNNECNLYKPIFESQGFLSTLRQKPYRIIPLNLRFTSNNVTIPALKAAILNTYFNGTQITLEKYISFCHDSTFKYPVLRTAHKRLETGAAPTFIYQFAYHGVNSTENMVSGEDYSGAAHAEDLSYFFRYNAELGPIQSDELTQPIDDSRMKQLMTTFFANFVKTGDPHSEWLPAGPGLGFMNIDDPMNPEFGPATPYMADMKQFFDDLYLLGRGE